MFTSALEFTKVRDFAYHDKHPLHYGVNIKDQPSEEEEIEIERSPNDIYRRAVALFDFNPENDNEIKLTEGQTIWVTVKHDQGWVVAEILETGETGLVPEEYVQILPEENDWYDN